MTLRPRILALLTLLLSLTIFPSAAAAAVPAPPDGAAVVRIDIRARADVERWAAELDLWEAHPEDGYVVARITASERAALVAQGYAVADLAGAMAAATIPDYACYRTIAEIEAQIDAWAGAYPQLVRVLTLGTSYEGRPLRVLHLTRHDNGVPDKPIFFLMANIHGRELITNETALVFAAHLLSGYGSDPDVTWLLDEHSIYVLVSANPDGHIRNEQGEPWSYWRRNADPSYGLCGGAFGVDLNRNHSYAWGDASPFPCSETYQGPAPASEPETQAVQAFLASRFADRRGSADTDPAPGDTGGLLITLHSYGDLVLWPWGYTTAAAPNAAELAALGTALAGYNGYVAQPSSDLYLTSGTTDDWLYGELGVAAFTFEIGRESDGEVPADGFYPPCSRYDALVQPNVAALTYGAKIARTPYQTGLGPQVHQVTVAPISVSPGAAFAIAAVVDEAFNGGQAVAAAEAYLDVPPWRGGVALPLAPTDGSFDAPTEAVSGTGDGSGLAAGRHLVYVRGMDAAGHWGAITAAFLPVTDGATHPNAAARILHLPLTIRAVAGPDAAIRRAR